MPDDHAIDDGSVRAALTPPLRRLLAGLLFSALGSGLTLSLLVVYLAQVRGLPLAVAGLVLSWMAVLGLAVAPAVGWVVDRVGPRRVLLVALVVEALGVLALTTVTTAPQAFAVATVVAVGNAGTWPPQSALLADLAGPPTRQRVFGIQFMLLNLGLGLGGLLGATIIDPARPETFVALYVVDALSYVVYVVAVLTLRGHGGPVARSAAADTDGVAVAGKPAGYREVLRDRVLRRLLLMSLVLLTCGYGSLEAGVPAYATAVAGLSPKVLGVVFACNTGVIVIAQVWVLHRMEGRSRARLMAVVAVLWAVSWLFVGASAPVSAGLAVASLCVGAAVFALGETVWSPLQPALLNDLAPAHLRGRYNALGSVTWNVAGALGPAVAGVMIGAGHGGAWIGLLVVGCGVAAVLAARLRGVLTPAHDGRRAGEPVPAVG